VKVLRLQPRAEAGIADLCVALPEIGLEAELNEEMVEVQLDDAGFSGKIAAHISRIHLDAGKLAALALGFDDHEALSTNEEGGSFGMSPV
jgi:hypothetical protein